MKIAKIKIQNVMGIEQLEVEPGKVTVVSGKNGSGKSSIIAAIKTALGGGHDATLLRKGTDEGQAVVILDDGTEITRRIRSDKTDTKVVREGYSIGQPSKFIADLFDSIAANPVEFLTASPKRRAEILLETMPVRIRLDKLSQAGVNIENYCTEDVVEVDIQALDFYAQDIYNDRTGHNRTAKDKAATVEQLKATIQDVEPVDYEDKIKVLEHELDVKNDICEQACDKFKQESIDAINQVNAKIQELMDIRAKYKANGDAAIERTRALLREETASMKAQVEVLDSKRQRAAIDARTRQNIEQYAKEAEGAKQAAERCTAQLEALEALKSEALQSTPIPGLAVLDGTVTYEGIAFDRLNTAKRVWLAVQIAKLRAGKLNVMMVDGLECLDAESFEAFKKEFEAGDIQVFATKVTDTELVVA